MIQVIIGGMLATLGGMVSIWFQAKNARRIRMDEIIAEKKIQANNEAYGRIKTIEAMLIHSDLERKKEKKKRKGVKPQNSKIALDAGIDKREVEGVSP